MEAFIKRYEYNYIAKCLADLGSAYKSCVDLKIINTNKAYINDKILKKLGNPSDEEKELLDISSIKDPRDITIYLQNLSSYVFGMEDITNAQIGRLFKKDKKLKFPNTREKANKLVYLGWVDDATRKLYITYKKQDKLLGMACRITNNNTNNIHMCVLCKHIGGRDEVTFVSPICKTNDTENSYRSIGFDICLNSEKCNERITDIEKLEELLMDVNNIK